jgi:hypothetical protein
MSSLLPRLNRNSSPRKAIPTSRKDAFPVDKTGKLIRVEMVEAPGVLCKSFRLFVHNVARKRKFRLNLGKVDQFIAALAIAR